MAGLGKHDEGRGLCHEVEGDQRSDAEPCSMDGHAQTPAAIRTQPGNFAVPRLTLPCYVSVGKGISLTELSP